MFAYGRPLTLEVTIARIDRIDASAVKEAGSAMLASPPTVAAIGPISKVYSPDRVAERIGAV